LGQSSLMVKNKKKSSQPVVASPPTVNVQEGTAAFQKDLGNKAFAAENFEKAIEYYTLAISMENPEDKESLSRIYSNRSVAYLSCRDPQYDNALEDAERCIAFASNWSKGYYRKAMVLKSLHRLQEAVETLEMGLKHESDNNVMQKEIDEITRILISEEIEHENRETNPDSDKFTQLIDWLLSGGSQFPKLYMKRYSENNRGVHSKERIIENEQIMYIPKQFLITVEMGKETSVGKKIIAANLDLTAMKHSFLCVFVLTDRKDPNSFYQPYYRILPTSYENMPICWDQDELECLSGSYMLQQIADRKRNIRSDYEDICRVAPEFNEVTLEEFRWARMMVASRNFGVTIDDIKTDALVPYADMLNHKRPRETKWTYEQSLSGFTITAIMDIGIGKQVYDSYGQKCNSRFLLNYGFAVENNRDLDGKCHNEVRLLFDLDPTDINYGTKCELLCSQPAERGIRVSMTCTDKSTKSALSYMRFVHAATNEIVMLPVMNRDFDLEETPIEPLSIDTEIKVLMMIRGLCERQLSYYPTTLEEDNIRLASDELPQFSNRRNALILIRGEKEVCHHWIKVAEIAIPLLNMEWKNCKKEINKKYSDPTNDLHKYMIQVVMPLVKKNLRTKQK